MSSGTANMVFGQWRMREALRHADNFGGKPLDSGPFKDNMARPPSQA
jgi:hypothetical protein